MAKTKIKSFEDLLNLKQRINILNDKGDTLFYLEEPSGEVLDNIMAKIHNDIVERSGEQISQDQNGQINMDLSTSTVIHLLRETVKGLEIKYLSDDEIKEIWKQLGVNVRSQIDKALNQLAVQEMTERVKLWYEKLQEDIRKAKKER